MGAQDRKKKIARSDAADRQRRKRRVDRERGIVSVTLRVPAEFADLIKTVAEVFLADPEWARRDMQPLWLPAIEARAARIHAKRARTPDGVNAATTGEGESIAEGVDDVFAVTLNGDRRPQADRGDPGDDGGWRAGGVPRCGRR